MASDGSTCRSFDQQYYEDVVWFDQAFRTKNFSAVVARLRLRGQERREDRAWRGNSLALLCEVPFEEMRGLLSAREERRDQPRVVVGGAAQEPLSRRLPGNRLSTPDV